MARQLKADFGTKGFDEKSLRRMMQFASEFTEEKIVAQLARQLSWSHFVEVLELYLRWLEKNEMEPGEESPLGLLLCTEGSEEQIELLQLDKSGIRVAQYMTELPPREVLIQQIRKSMEIAKGLGKS